MPAPVWWLLALPLVAGACLPLQAGINGQLAKHVSSVLAAGLISFTVGSLALLLVVLVQREAPSFGLLRGVSWWQWCGGFLGVFFIVTAAFAGPRVGALLFMALVIAGQLGMALTLDHFGWAGFREAPISAGKLLGVLAIGVGIWLIRRG
ncbi:DMT family transporter [Pseudomonas cavernae]|uniref:DMT family transporter n=1 Tax=Pseudomonas cavernae TaxID=2320867 RepID=A0A385Z8N6_9PSED|nr:DMT family transporter [Pseudomonas cavernae]AYC34477.1 DMT family transporter [Pseudomonas cavernae]